LSAETAALLRGNAIDAVLHYSRRSAAAFAALAGKEDIGLAGGRPRHLCLSAAVAMPLREAGAEVRTASRPDETALFALLDP
jgi:uroporphyrinogen-III synthase